MLVCPRCRGLVEPGSPICPSCAYDPHTGDTALLPRRTFDGDHEPSAVATVISGLTVLVAIVLVVSAAVFISRAFIVDRPNSSPRTFATESSGTTVTR